ncbi:MAG: fumarylacetoacetate hydrolase family protein [Marinifilaceae bacterium]|jgi:2-keto-4-pentenoate hydratase/2-oxohepta-3-ene-1,7-dioic acid hydratase in catechol pathway|nr:fumarylacetoacetate hydrolase family protein [Marinifilaceae bacterium]
MKILCIGRNYINHAKELNNPVPSEPVFFIKPDTALLRNNDDFYHPDFSEEIHHEIEFVVRIGKLGKNIDSKFAHRYIDSVALGVDFTARDIQSKCKEKGLPWEKAKAFDHSAPISKFIKASEFEDLQNIEFSLKKNGEIVQLGNTRDMIFKINDLIAYLSKFFTLKIGDLIYTGTPAGVSKVNIDDHLVGCIEDREMLNFHIK